jgi:hypothetical protein
LALLLYCAILATLCLIYRSARRIHARLRSGDEPMKFCAIPFLRQLAFPTLFVSAILATRGHLQGELSHIFGRAVVLS